ncbi:MAG: DegT/DnrJ/EryC1/StrS family aminotransferase [Cyclobacteriaceae bacterium]
MQIPFVNLQRQHQPFISELQDLVSELLATNMVMGGKSVRKFEAEFASYIGVNYALSCANATDALEVVLRAWEIKAGDEVIVPANGWMSAAEAVLLVGATPVFIDNKPNGYGLDEELIEDKVNDCTKAIIPIHLYGDPVDISKVSKISERFGLKVLEDCAQAHGASVEGKKVGSWGQAGIFSFYPTKNLGALGDGGMIVTSDKSLADKCIAIANHGQSKPDRHHLLGRNSRMDALQAKILSLKLPYLDQWNNRRRQIANYYLKSWADLPVVLPSSTDNSVWHLFVLRVDRREKVIAELSKKGVATKVHYPTPVSQQPIFEKYSKSEAFPNAEQHAPQLLSIPVYPELSDSEVEYIARTVKSVIEAVEGHQ